MGVVLENKAKRPSFVADVVKQAFGRAFTRDFWVNVFTAVASDLAAVMMNFMSGKLAFYARKMAGSEPSQESRTPFSSGAGAAFSAEPERPVGYSTGTRSPFSATGFTGGNGYVR